MKISSSSKIINELIYNGKKYLSLKHAALLSNYHRDYLGQLIRKKELTAEKIGFAWFIEENEWKKFLNRKNCPDLEPRGLEIKEVKMADDIWEKALLGQSKSHNLEMKIQIPKIKINQQLLSLAASALIVTGIVFFAPDKFFRTIDGLGEFSKNAVTETAKKIMPIKVVGKNGNTYFLALSLPSLPNLSFSPPFTLSDIAFSISDIKLRFGQNLFAWREYVRGWFGDVRKIALDFFSSPSPLPPVLPPASPASEPKIITFPAQSPKGIEAGP